MREADVGHKIAVELVTRVDDVGIVASRSYEVLIDAHQVSQLGSSSLTGTPRPGTTLTAHPARWDRPTTTTFQWTRDGRPIPAATGPTLRLRPSDRGARIAVTLTATAPHHGVIAIDTHRVRVERYVSATTIKVNKSTIKQGHVVNLRVTVAAAGHNRPVTGRLRVVNRHDTILLPYLTTAHNGKTQLQLHGLAVGTHRIWVRYYGNRVVGRSRSRPLTLTVTPTS